MSKPADLNRCLAPLDQDHTIIAVIEMSQSSWLVAGVVPGIARHPLKKLAPDQDTLLKLLHRWRAKASQAGREITRIAVAFEAGRDGFWLALAPGSRHRSSCHSPDQRGRLPRASARQDRPARHRPAQARVPRLAEGRAGALSHGCHSDPGGRGCPAPHPRARRLGGRAHPDREPDQSGPGAPGSAGLQAGLAKALERLDALRTPEGTALPPNTRAELHRDMARLHFVTEQIQQIEAARSERLEQHAGAGPNAMVRLLAQVVGVGIETADMLVHEVLSRNLRDRRAVARYAGLTGSPDESGNRRREKGLAKAGNARVRRGMIQLAWRFLLFQKESALASGTGRGRPTPGAARARP